MHSGCKCSPHVGHLSMMIQCGQNTDRIYQQNPYLFNVRWQIWPAWHWNSGKVIFRIAQVIFCWLMRSNNQKQIRMAFKCILQSGEHAFFIRRPCTARNKYQLILCIRWQFRNLQIISAFQNTVTAGVSHHLNICMLRKRGKHPLSICFRNS